MRSLNMTSRNVIAVLAGALMALPVAARAQVNADVSVKLTDAPTAVHYGETVTYTATLTNLGPSAAEGVTITDITVALPLVLKAVSGCTPPEGATDLVPCIVDDSLRPGEIVEEADPAHPVHQKVVTFDVELPMPDTGLPTACPTGTELSAVSITVGAQDYPAATPPIVATVDPDLANNVATSDVPTIGHWADLGITMEAPASSSIGSTFDVVNTVTNDGPCAATQVAADDEQGVTSLGIEFLGAEGDCDQDPVAGTCSWDTLASGESKTWTIHYRVLNFPSGLMRASEDVSLTVFSNADDAFDYNADNDVARTDTIVKKNRANCSTGGGMGQALSLLALGLPFLRRRRRR